MEAFEEMDDDGLISLFNGVATFKVYLIPKPPLQKNSIGTIQPIAGKKSICSKVNVTARLEFELPYNNVTIYLVSYYSTDTKL